MTRFVVVSLLFVISLFVSSPSAQTSAAIHSDRLADSVGINVHLHHTDTLYSNFDLVQWFLYQLGVRHERDSMIDTTWQGYYDRHNALGALGIKGLFNSEPLASEALLRSYPTRVARSFEGYELPNEFDISGLANWPALMLQSLVPYQAIEADPALTNYPVVGPGLTSPDSWAALGDISGYYDYANIHDYLAGRNPGTPGWGDGGYGSIDWNLALAARWAPGRPVIATETGYSDDPGVPDALPAVIVGRYMPRLLLEQFRKGITRTYIHELVDYPAAGVFAASGQGLVRADGSWKPAFFAVQNLIRVFADPGAAPSPASLDYTLTGGNSSLRQMVFQKRDGSFLLAVWLEIPAYDPPTRSFLPVTPVTVRITVPRSSRLARTYQWRDGGGVTESTALAGERNITVSVSDSLLVLQFGGRN